MPIGYNAGMELIVRIAALVAFALTLLPVLFPVGFLTHVLVNRMPLTWRLLSIFFAVEGAAIIAVAARYFWSLQIGRFDS